MIVPFIREGWLAIRLARCWLIGYEDVVAAKGKITRFATNGLEPFKVNQPLHLKQQEILVTRPGVLTTVSHLTKSVGVSNPAVCRYVQKGLKAQRVGGELLVYEDDWEDFLRREWARPRFRHPDWLPMPEGAILGPIVPSPYIGKTKEELMQRRLAGWMDWYAEQLLKGEPPPLPRPRTRRVRRKYGFLPSGRGETGGRP